jgi:GNAT superfamily N-acetyltransferase
MKTATEYEHVLARSADGRFIVVGSQPWMVNELEHLQRAAFPTLAAHELTLATHYDTHLTVFPEGQFAVVETRSNKVVASSTDFRTTLDFNHYQHTFSEATGLMTLTTHQPSGDWLYGADISVHPDYRGFKLSTLLYEVRHDLVRRLNLRGHVAGAMPKGYGEVQHLYAIEDYVHQVVQGQRSDPVLSVQLKRGFRVWGILPDYLNDPSCANYGVFIVWRNTDWKPV